MTDIKKIKKELLDAFNSAGAAPAAVNDEGALDSVLRLYFCKASHMPRQLTFLAVMNSLKIEKHDRQLSPQAALKILNRYC